MGINRAVRSSEGPKRNIYTTGFPGLGNILFGKKKKTQSSRLKRKRIGMFCHLRTLCWKRQGALSVGFCAGN